MKMFINVLYRRILYKIPLKLLLILVAVFGVLFACFSSASNLDFTENYYFKTGHLHLTDVNIVQLYDFQNNPNNVQYTSLDSVCIIISAITGFTSTSNANSSIQCGINQINYISNRLNLYYNVNSQTACFPLHSLSNYNRLNCKATSNNYINGSVDFDYGLFLLSSALSSGGGDCPTCPRDKTIFIYSGGNLLQSSAVPSNYDSINLNLSGNLIYNFTNSGNISISSSCPDQYSSLECQSEYNLIPISSVDSNYCESNNLCSSSDCPTYTGDLTPGVSNIFINDVFHPGAFNVIMNIPEEIDWDYSYTNSGQNLNIDVVGYNVDYEKMQSVIDLQNYKPTDDDFSEIIGVLAPYSKIIIFFVVLFSLWAMIKKPFKSKKL